MAKLTFGDLASLRGEVHTFTAADGRVYEFRRAGDYNAGALAGLLAASGQAAIIAERAAAGAATPEDDLRLAEVTTQILAIILPGMPREAAESMTPDQRFDVFKWYQRQTRAEREAAAEKKLTAAIRSDQQSGGSSRA